MDVCSTLIAVAIFLSTNWAFSAETGPWDLPSLQTPPKVTWLDDHSPIRSLVYSNEPFHGQPTRVFAFYATPGSLQGDRSIDKNLPGVVLIHGGGGTAFAEWVHLWAKRGYAAIAMDLSGRRPTAPSFDPGTGEFIPQRRTPRTRLPDGGPEADSEAKFNTSGGDLSDDWQYHAVAAVIRAHSLLRSFPEVDADRTAVTGISWGGYLTCLVASIDDRFKAAVPVYGCGYLHDGQSVQRRLIDALEPRQRREWIRLYEPSSWLTQCRVPILFVNGTNDKHYPLDSYDRSYALVPAALRQIRLEVAMPHGHISGWTPREIGLFVDHYLKGAAPLPRLGDPEIEESTSEESRTAVVRATVTHSPDIPLKRAELHYTTDDGPLVDRRWQSTAATIEGKTVKASLPLGAKIWLLSVTDARDAMISTRSVFAK